MYRGVKFEKLSDEQIMRQIELARATDAEGVRRVFLADGDALVLPTGRLLKILAVLKEYFPNLERVASYAAPGDILRNPWKNSPPSEKRDSPCSTTVWKAAIPRR